MALESKGRKKARALPAAAVAAVLICSGSALAGAGGSLPLPTTVDDFFQPGTQPLDLTQDFLDSTNCSVCHADYDDGEPNGETVQPYNAWVQSMMAHSARDPIWHAALAITNQDATDSGEYCIRCHVPFAWLNGRSLPADGSGITEFDRDGISCHFCHRKVDPVFTPENPAQDMAILAGLSDPPDPSHFGNARYIIDPMDSRRGPFVVPLNLHPAPILISPYHQESLMCAECHDVSNPAFERQPDGTLVLSANNAPHATQDPNDMFPEQRTFSEWLNSDFATTGVVFADGRFGGNLPNKEPIGSCQDCHMPDREAGGCNFWESDPFFKRPDMPQHTFAGANSWVLGAVLDEYGEAETGLTAQTVAEAQARTVSFLQAASDIEVTQDESELQVRVINFTGHKLPTGYPEGRRMWVNVVFLDENDSVLEERGAYDTDTAELVEDTKIYEAVNGIDAAVAAATGLPQGESNHLSLNNVRLFDNRIPPMGFTNAAYESIRAQPVGYAYADGQHWDDTTFEIPRCATSVVVNLYYQTTTKEYIEFLFNENTSNSAGVNAMNRWLDHGKSVPVAMDSTEIKLAPGTPGDATGDAEVDVFDMLAVLEAWGCSGVCAEDVNCDGLVDVFDLLDVLNFFGR